MPLYVRSCSLQMCPGARSPARPQRPLYRTWCGGGRGEWAGPVLRYKHTAGNSSEKLHVGHMYLGSTWCSDRSHMNVYGLLKTHDMQTAPPPPQSSGVGKKKMMMMFDIHQRRRTTSKDSLTVHFTTPPPSPPAQMLCSPTAWTWYHHEGPQGPCASSNIS